MNTMNYLKNQQCPHNQIITEFTCLELVNTNKIMILSIHIRRVTSFFFY